MVFRMGIERSQEAHPVVVVEIEAESALLCVIRIPVGLLIGQHVVTTEATQMTER